MQCANDYVESQPNDEQPTGPIAAVQHEHAGNNLGGPGKMDHPMFFEVGNALCAVHVERGPPAGDQGNGAKDNKQPTDDGD